MDQVRVPTMNNGTQSLYFTDESFKSVASSKTTRRTFLSKYFNRWFQVHFCNSQIHLIDYTDSNEMLKVQMWTNGVYNQQQLFMRLRNVPVMWHFSETCFHWQTWTFHDWTQNTIQQVTWLSMMLMAMQIN